MDERRVLAPAGDLGESPLLPAAALVAAAGLYADLPSRFIVGPGGGAFGVVRWVVPALTVFVLATFVVIRPHGSLVRAFGWGERALHLTRRRLALVSIGFVSAANSAAILLLIHLLVNGAITHNAAPLLRAALHMWAVNVLLFGLWYWQLDSFTNAAAFSPTDTMPLSRWAKMLMLVQSAISLALAVMVVARAVNILR